MERGERRAPGRGGRSRGGRRWVARAHGTARALLTAAAFVLVGAVGRPAAVADEGGAAAPVVRDVRVLGHASLSTREVARIIAGEIGSPFDEAALSARADSLLARLADLGRPFARVEVGWKDEDDGVGIDVRVDEGPEIVLAALEFRGAEAVDLAEVMARSASRAGSPAVGGALEEDIEALLSAYEEAGRPFAAVTPGTAMLAPDGGVSIDLWVDEGVEVRLGALVAVGNSTTKDRVIVRESGIETGEVLARSRLDRVRPRLERLGIFGSVSEPVVAVDPATGLATVGIEVAERPANSIIGVVGYAPSGEGDGELTGRAEVVLGNIAGTGRRASADWARVRSRETRIGFSYWEPWVLGAPIDVGVEGLQTVSDTVYTTTEGDLFVSARMGDRARVTWSIGGERYVPGALDESTTTSVRTSIGAEYDGTDVPGNPSSGNTIAAVVEYAAKEERGSGRKNRSGTLRVDAGTHVSLRPRHVVALAARIAGLASTEEEVPYHELLVLGGANDLRGYREEQFRGTRTALGTIEYRFILGRRSRAIAFVDVGYFYRGGSNFAKDTKLGYGIGLRGETRLGIIGLDYGLGEGDGLLDGKLHVGLIREF